MSNDYFIINMNVKVTTPQECFGLVGIVYLMSFEVTLSSILFAGLVSPPWTSQQQALIIKGNIPTYMTVETLLSLDTTMVNFPVIIRSSSS